MEKRKVIIGLITLGVMVAGLATIIAHAMPDKPQTSPPTTSEIQALNTTQGNNIYSYEGIEQSMTVGEYKLLLDIVKNSLGEYIIGFQGASITDLSDNATIIVNYEFISETYYPELILNHQVMRFTEGQ